MCGYSIFQKISINLFYIFGIKILGDLVLVLLRYCVYNFETVNVIRGRRYYWIRFIKKNNKCFYFILFGNSLIVFLEFVIYGDERELNQKGILKVMLICEGS